MIKIGIDLAMNSCGICIYDDKKQNILYSSTHHFIKRNMNFQTQLECKALVELLLEKIPPAVDKVGMYIEIGNYGNARMTQKFGILSGMIIATLIELLAKKTRKIYLTETKLITPNEWFSKLVSDKKNLIDKHYNQLSRDERKKISMDASGLRQNDISDAYWIAYYGDKCKGAYDA